VGFNLENDAFVALFSKILQSYLKSLAFFIGNIFKVQAGLAAKFCF